MSKSKKNRQYHQEKFKLIFDNSPIAIWEEDLSALAKLRRYLRSKEVRNVKEYLIDHPELVKKTFRNIKILDVNKAAIDLYGAKTKQELIANLGKKFNKAVLDILTDEFTALLKGTELYEAEFRSKTLQGKLRDVLLKVSVPKQYAKSFSRVIITLQDISERKKLERHLLKMSQVDSLTKLYNHNTINQRLEAEFIRSKRYGSSLSCMMIDVDHFKVINDEFGHQKGDDVIKQVANTLKNTIRQVDIVGRYGGDEFVIILPETKPQRAKIAAERIQNIFDRKKFRVQKGTTVSIALSIGISGCPARGIKSVHQLIAKADKAMYLAKKSGRNRVAVL